MMVLLSWLSTFAGAQTLLTPADHGATVTLSEPGVVYAADASDRSLDLDQLTLATPTYVATFGQVYDELLRAGAAPRDLLMVTLGERGQLQAALVSRLDDDDEESEPDCGIFDLRCGCAFWACWCAFVYEPMSCGDDEILPFPD